MLILCNEGHANHAVRGMPCTTPSVWTVGLVWTLCTECSALWAGTGLTLLSWITLMIKKTYLMFWWSVQYKHLHFHVPPDPYFCQFSVHNSISGWWNCVQKTVGCAFKIWNKGVFFSSFIKRYIAYTTCNAFPLFPHGGIWLILITWGAIA